jgi:hypothetical protein
MMSRAVNAWDRFWFSPTGAAPIAALRVVLLGYLTAVRLPEEVGLLLYRNDWPKELMAPGVALRLSPLPFPFPLEHLNLFHTAMVLAGMCAAVGLATRPALLLFAVGYSYMKGVESAWGSFDHEPTIVVQLLFILVFAPGATAYSADRLIGWLVQRRGEEGANLASAVAGSPVPRWGVQLVLVLVATMYCTAGVAKLRHGGIAWLDGSTLAFYMSGKSQSSRIQQYGGGADLPEARKWKDGFGLEFYILGARSSRLAEAMARRPSSFVLAAIGAVSLELLAPLILLGGAFRTGLLLGAAGMHLFIGHFLNISFLSWIVIDLVMIDWRWLVPARRVRSRRRWAAGAA